MLTDGDREKEAAGGGSVEDAKEFIKTIPDFADTLKEAGEGVDETELDETGAVEAAEYAGDVHPSKLEPVSEKVKHGDKYIAELPIEYLINPANKQVFAVTPDLMKRRDLVACDEHGKKVYDHRCF